MTCSLRCRGPECTGIVSGDYRLCLREVESGIQGEKQKGEAGETSAAKHPIFIHQSAVDQLQRCCYSKLTPEASERLWQGITGL